MAMKPHLLPVIHVMPSCSKQVENSRKEAEDDGITVPTTVDEYCLQHKKQQTSSIDMTDDYFDRDDEYYQDYSASDSDDEVIISTDEEGGDQVDGDSGTAWDMVTWRTLYVPVPVHTPPHSVHHFSTVLSVSMDRL